MNYTPEQLAALPDIELQLIIARDVAGLEAETVNGVVFKWLDVEGDPLRQLQPIPDYLNDLNAIDDLCKEKGFTWLKSRKHLTICPNDFIMNFVNVEVREGIFPRCRFLCEALVLAHQESTR